MPVEVAGDPLDRHLVVSDLGQLLPLRFGELAAVSRPLRDVVGAGVGAEPRHERIGLVGRIVEFGDELGQARIELGLEQALEHLGLERPIAVEIGSHGVPHPVEVRGQAAGPVARDLRAAGR